MLFRSCCSTRARCAAASTTLAADGHIRIRIAAGTAGTTPNAAISADSAFARIGTSTTGTAGATDTVRRRAAVAALRTELTKVVGEGTAAAATFPAGAVDAVAALATVLGKRIAVGRRGVTAITAASARSTGAGAAIAGIPATSAVIGGTTSASGTTISTGAAGITRTAHTPFASRGISVLLRSGIPTGTTLATDRRLAIASRSALATIDSANDRARNVAAGTTRTTISIHRLTTSTTGTAVRTRRRCPGTPRPT